MGRDETFPALERLKQEASGLDVLVDVSPPWLETTLEYLFQQEYAERRQALYEQREATRETFSDGRHRIESTYGTTVMRVLRRRHDGEPPNFDPERFETDLDDATQAIAELCADLEFDFLTRPEQRQLIELREDILDAKEYVRNKREFDSRKESIAELISEFNERFDPYVERDQYMVSSDEQFLTVQSLEIWEQLAALARELKLHVLPDADADWLGTEKTRFNGYTDALPQYNETFVADKRLEYEDVFQTEHGPLNEQQQKAVIRNDRRNLIDASAGTGKTLTLTRRFVYLLRRDVPPREIRAITYTSDAAEEMKRRISDAVPDVDEDDLQISTIHSFANEIYRRSMETRGNDRDLGEARSDLVASWVSAALNDEQPQGPKHTSPEDYQQFKTAFERFERADSSHGYVDEEKSFQESWEEFVLTTFEEFTENARTFGLTGDEIRNRLDGSHAVAAPFGEAASYLVAAYNAIVAGTDGPTDFDDMVETATEVVKSNQESFDERYQHLLVDEFQDVSDSTLQFVDSFVMDGGSIHLFCVGDDWQSIFGFSGSNVRYFTEYEDRFDDVTYTQLQVNYRCPPQIVEAGTALMDQSSAPQNEKAVRAAADETDESVIELHTIDGLYDEWAVDHVATMIERAIVNRPYDDVMVLSRNDENSRYMRDLRNELEERNIPHKRPKHWPDYLPDEYAAELDRDVEYDEQGYATYADEPNTDDDQDRPPRVLTQSIHASKGTEAPIVIYLHAVDDDPDGIPSERRHDPLLEPSVDITADHIPEERRLFYVALTRAEEEFIAVTQSGNTSRFITDIDEYFTPRTPEYDIIGECIDYTPPEENRPYKATLDCGEFDAEMFAWPESDPPTLDEGTVYSIEDPIVEHSKYGDQINFGESTIHEYETEQ